MRGNRARDLRYGLHYMFSDDNIFEDNTFENGAAGAALMYSRRIVFRRNRFLHNRGFASVGLLLKACDDVVAEDNLIADNARGDLPRGLVPQRVPRQRRRRCRTSRSSSTTRAAATVFEGNVVRRQPDAARAWSGRRTDTVFDGNYWSDNREPDLDGDGIADRPYRLTNVFDHLRGNLTAADLCRARLRGARAGARPSARFPCSSRCRSWTPPPLARAAGSARRAHAGGARRTREI